MVRVQVITDSNSSLSLELAEKYGIRLVPVSIHFGDDIYTTNLDIDDQTLFEKIDHYNKLPITEAPTTKTYTAAYNEAFVSGAKEILCITLSSELSKSYESAIQASREFPGQRIKIIDSRYLSIGQGFLAIAAAEAIGNGATLDEATHLVESMIPNLHTFASLSTLKYIAMSGRAGKVLAGITSVLNIRPTLTIKNGILQMIERIRSHDAVLDRLAALLCNSVKNKLIIKAAIYHVNNLEDAQLLKSKLQEELQLPDEILTVAFTPGLSAHAGNKLVGAAFYAK